jgi:hypothetical protein
MRILLAPILGHIIAFIMLLSACGSTNPPSRPDYDWLEYRPVIIFVTSNWHDKLYIAVAGDSLSVVVSDWLRPNYRDYITRHVRFYTTSGDTEYVYLFNNRHIASITHTMDWWYQGTRVATTRSTSYTPFNNILEIVNDQEKAFVDYVQPLFPLYSYGDTSMALILVDSLMVKK